MAQAMQWKEQVQSLAPTTWLSTPSGVPTCIQPGTQATPADSPTSTTLQGQAQFFAECLPLPSRTLTGSRRGCFNDNRLQL